MKILLLLKKGVCFFSKQLKAKWQSNPRDGIFFHSFCWMQEGGTLSVETTNWPLFASACEHDKCLKKKASVVCYHPRLFNWGKRGREAWRPQLSNCPLWPSSFCQHFLQEEEQNRRRAQKRTSISMTEELEHWSSFVFVVVTDKRVG